MRVISGKYGGRPLDSLPGDHIRPTGDKLKETLFNIIGPYFKGGKVLDLYAGSGALGIEAVSRGMDEAILVDKSQSAFQVIADNIKMTKEEEKFESIHAPSDIAINQLAVRNEKFTLVFLDPPYAMQTIEQDIQKIIDGDLLSDVALIVCETAADVDLPDEIDGLSKWQEKSFRHTKLVIYQKALWY